MDRKVIFLYSEEYFRCLEGLPVHSDREKKTFSLILALGLSKNVQFLAPTPATLSMLERFHAKEYLNVLRYSIKEKKNSNDLLEEFGLIDDAYLFDGVFEYCQFVAGASITAADALLHLMQQQQRHSYENDPKQMESRNNIKAPVVMNLGGGRHHAMRSNASGFCYVNDVVLSIQSLITPLSKVQVVDNLHVTIDRLLCIDMDVHHGDGVQEAFFFSEKVTTVSFHLFEKTFFPGTGDSDEKGMGKGKYNNINIPLKRGITDEQYVKLFSHVVSNAIQTIEPQVIVLVCGVDTLAR
jgi:acetoin utilization deacetylase AcuC-like enzyme